MNALRTLRPAIRKFSPTRFAVVYHREFSDYGFIEVTNDIQHLSHKIDTGFKAVDKKIDYGFKRSHHWMQIVIATVLLKGGFDVTYKTGMLDGDQKK